VAQRIGKYEVEGVLGEGGMAVVYKARDTVLGRDVALKVIHQFLQEGERARRRFLNEARVAATLTHPNIVTVFELGEDGSLPYIAMEYLPGRDLAHHVEAGDLNLAQKIEVARQVALGLEHAHSRQVIHRDIKPRNIKLLPTGAVKLMDFGIAKLASEHLTKTGHAVGTPSYMSPEQILGQSVRPASDVFSFGVVLYELLSGRLPFAGRNLQELIAAIVGAIPPPLWIEDRGGSELIELVMRCLAKPLEERYAGFTQVVVELERVLSLHLRPDSVELSARQIRASLAEAGTSAASEPVRAAVRPAGALREFTDSRDLRVRAQPAEPRMEAAPSAASPQPVAPRKGGLSPIFVLGLILIVIAAIVIVASLL
jgi:serine/threonine-protein kinase